jgi:hypothetical protein
VRIELGFSRPGGTICGEILEGELHRLWFVEAIDSSKINAIEVLLISRHIAMVVQMEENTNK